jgi:hypothetical protein
MVESRRSKQHDESNAPEPVIAEGVNLRILVVEDDEGFAELLRVSLEAISPNVQLRVTTRQRSRSSQASHSTPSSWISISRIVKGYKRCIR